MPPAAGRSYGDPQPLLLPRTYNIKRILGKGTYGSVYEAFIEETGETVAIKDVAFSANDREVSILRELDGHPNIIGLQFLFASEDKQKLHLVLEYASDTMHRVIRHHNVLFGPMDLQQVRLYTYQLLRAIAYAHSHGIMHCDVKPQNLLIDGATKTLKVCDWGTAKRVDYRETSASYVCSRYYRAPELCIGSTHYGYAVDTWSCGCVYSEMILGQPLFPGRDGTNQFMEIIKILGTPSPEELKAMNHYYPEYEFTPKVAPYKWSTVFRGFVTDAASDLAGLMLCYDPGKRIKPLQALCHRFFHELRKAECPDFPSTLFEFGEDELTLLSPQEREVLTPAWFQQKTERLRQEKLGAKRQRQQGAKQQR